MLYRLVDSCKCEVESDIVSREEWEAQAPVLRSRSKFAVKNVILVYRTGPERCVGKDECMEVLRKIQKSNMNQELDDIQFNFLVGGDGLVYEGRGWQTVCPVPRKYNTIPLSFLIGFIGDYSQMEPSYAMMLSAMKVIDMAVDKGIMTQKYDIVTYRKDS